MTEVQEVKTDPWKRLEGKVSPLVLTAPKTCGDPMGDWRKVEDNEVKYLERSVLGQPWTDQITLAFAVMVAHNLDIHTIRVTLTSLNTRLRRLFPALGLKTMADWQGGTHMKRYLESEILPEDSDTSRVAFWKNYVSVVNHTYRWFRALDKADQDRYRHFVFPYINSKEFEEYTSYKEILERQRQKRKDETEALLPHFMEIRAQAHLRFNKMNRLREAWIQATQTIVEKGCSLPFKFSYEEGQERFHFIVWDKRSIALNHKNLYDPSTIKKVQQGKGTYSDSKNRLFLESVGAERLHDDSPPEGLWFEEMLRIGVVGQAGQRLQNTELAKKRQEWLRIWGYGGDNGDKEEFSAPFKTQIPGVLNWTQEDAVYISQVQKKTGKIFIPVEHFYIATLFGLLAAELFTTTGMRINEFLQIRLTPEAFTRIEIPPTAEGQPPSYRYAFHLIPKGERTNKTHEFFIAPETTKLLVRVAKMLESHYALNPEAGESLPTIEFNADHARSHRFGSEPYLLQYNGRHLDDRDITACMRFLLHGMIFKTRDGEIVVLKAHLLRHGFATHAVQVEKIPIDIVGKWLHQKDVDVTWYYAKATQSQVAEYSDVFLSRIASHFNLKEFVTRTPEEMREQVEEAVKRTGTLNKVVGGSCTFHGLCIHGLVCPGCIHNIPNPEERRHTIHQRDWAMKELDYNLHNGLLIEAEKCKDLIRRYDLMLAEMDAIENYLEDEKYEVQIQIN